MIGKALNVWDVNESWLKGCLQIFLLGKQDHLLHVVIKKDPSLHAEKANLLM